MELLSQYLTHFAISPAQALDVVTLQQIRVQGLSVMQGRARWKVLLVEPLALL